MRHWQIQHAKNRLSEVLREAAMNGPQVITHHGREAGVLLSMEDYRQLTRSKVSLVEFFRTSPLAGDDLLLERSSETAEVLDL